MLAFIYVFSIWVVATMLFVAVNAVEPNRRFASALIKQHAEGLNCLAEAAQIIEAASERYCEPEIYRVRGDLLNATGDQAAAEQSYYQSLAVADGQSAKLSELRAATSLARIWRDHGKITEALDLLAAIYAWFTEGFDTPVLMEAKALLDELRA
jgi:predicted ATPase